MNSVKKTNNLTKIALVAALQCIISPFAIIFPFSPVPVSAATLMLYLSAYILGTRNATISCGIYLLIGFVGIPVFSGFSGGAGKILGPTGGYLVGYLFLVFISGVFVERGNNYMVQVTGLMLGTVVCYLVGSLWLMYQTGMDFAAAWNVGALPFIPADVIKIVIGAVTGAAVRRKLLKAGVL